MDLKLEVIVLPVSDVDRARSFYEAAGFRMDADHAADDDYRVVQFTPPGSECAVIFGKGSPPPSPARSGACTSSSRTSRRPARSSAAEASR